MFARFKKFIAYLFGKSAELSDMGANDILLGKVVLDIHRTKAATEFIVVPLYALRQIHPINRENSLQDTARRVAALQEVKERLQAEKNITRAVLAEYLPSVSWIKVVKAADDAYIAFEGNGRLVAMQQVFAPEDGIMVEVENYRFENPRKILRRIERVRRLNGVAGEDY
ncbi:MAG: hypothetical protein C0622_12060 [Desulfuromonas sp.]|nr:MAG: hypothetical protein C0622_12060 [Desulfuromonas sp.]